MRLRLRVNGGRTITGAIGGNGILGAQITVVAPAGKDKMNLKAGIHAYDSSGTSEWKVEKVSVGDKIEIEVLPGTDADPPTETRQSLNEPMLLFSEPDQARNALAAAHICNEQLQGILRAAGKAEPHDEAIKVQRAIAWLVQNLGAHLVHPIVRRHPNLLSEAKELGLLD